MRGSAIVTGGSRGIGRAIVDRLVADGASVTTCGRGHRPGDLPAAVTWISADVSRPSDAARIVDHALATHGGLDVLVNNAGVQLEKAVSATTDADWDLVIDTNCRGVFNMCRAALPHLERTGGSIVNVGSTAGETAEREMALYNASKAFVHSLTRSIAVDHGPQVRCNAVSPGWIDTDLAAAGFAVATDPQAARTDAVARHPLRRLGEPSDVAACVAWLISADATFVTGQCITVDGGLTMASPLNPAAL